jgi:hypothetical protein
MIRLASGGLKNLAEQASSESPGSILADFSPTLNTARASSPIQNDENKSQLEKTTFLSLAAGVLHHGISGFSSACSASDEDKS